MFANNRSNLLREMALSCLLICTIPLSYADTMLWEQRLREQLDEAELTGHEQFSFTQTVISREETKVSTFNPLNSPKWQLVAIDGHAPTEKERDKFVKQQLNEAERREGEKFGDLIKPNSIQIVSEGPEEVLIQFTPFLKDMADEAEEFMRGEAIFNKTDNRLRELRIYSVDAFSPSIAMKIEKMAMTFQFEAMQGQTLPNTYLFSFQGKFAAMKNIDVDSTITYSDYRRAVMN